MATKRKQQSEGTTVDENESTTGLIDGDESESVTDGTVDSIEIPIGYDGDFLTDYPNGMLTLTIEPVKELTFIDEDNKLTPVDFIDQSNYNFIGFSGEAKVFRRIA